MLESQYPTYFREQQRLLDTVRLANESIGKASDRWFELANEHDTLNSDIKLVGDKASIINARDDFKLQIAELREANSLSADDLKTYQDVVEAIAAKQTRMNGIETEAQQLSDYIITDESHEFIPAPGTVHVDIELIPEPANLSEPLAKTVKDLVAEAESGLVAKVEAAIVSHQVALGAESEQLEKELSALKTDNKDLLEKHQANKTLTELVRRQKAQQDSLDRIDAYENRRSRVIESQDAILAEIEEQLHVRSSAFESLSELFAEEAKTKDQLVFGIEYDVDTSTITALSEPFRKNQSGSFIKKTDDSDTVVDVAKAQQVPSEFLMDLFSEKQKLNQGNSPADVAKRVLTATPEVRFTATLDGDRIGGFERSTMTPGKQALFALTLILGEAEDRWTLLIDQPEDDLDSRSIYTDIVRYLIDQKKQRQIILVTHNANLVVGADAEAVIVANRHGDNRMNKDGRIFDYMTGSLEHSKKRKAFGYELERMGIREHAIEILDGGKEAFQKRRDKYKI